MSERITEHNRTIAARYDACKEDGCTCAEAALRAMDTEIFNLPEEDLRAARAFAYGSGIGDRCGIFTASIMAIGLLYGRSVPNFAWQYDRQLVRQLFDGYMEAFGSVYCQGCEQCGAYAHHKLELLLQVLAQAQEEGKERWTMDREILMDTFGVDDRLKPIADTILSPDDWRMMEAADEERVIPEGKFAQDLLEQEYCRGILNKYDAGGKIGYKLGYFPRRIDCCMRGERQLWDSLDEAMRQSFIQFMQDFDVWVFPELEEGEWEKSIIMPVEEVIEQLAATDRLIYIQDCDCRIYRGDPCGKPINTCIHWPASLLNTPYDRGYAKAVSKEEAIQRLKMADEAGLIHSLNSDGNLCNCCTCCCWAFRGLARLEEKGYSPKKDFYQVNYAIAVDEEKCVNCGACAGVCPFGVLQQGENHIEADTALCYGCGVCRAQCPTGALSLTSLTSSEEV